MPRLLIATFLGFAGVVIFGATLPMTRLAVLELDAAAVTAGRAFVAGLLAISVLFVMRRPYPKGQTKLLLLTGACIVLGWPLLTAIAMETVPASHGGIITGILPLATAVAAVIVNGERPSPLFWALSVFGAAIVIVFAVKDVFLGDGLRLVFGDILLLLGVASAGLGYALSGKLAVEMPGWEVISWALVASFPFSAVALALTIGDVDWAASASAWGGFLYVAIMSQFVGFFFWNTALAMGGVARIGQIMLFITFVTIATSALLLDETIDDEMWVFAGAVALVVMLGQRARIQRATEAKETIE